MTRSGSVVVMKWLVTQNNVAKQSDGVDIKLQW